MQAIILAAGIGKRLSAVIPDSPKCLLEIGGKSLMQRHIELLETLDVEHLHLVVGYQAGQISAHLASIQPTLPITLLHNPDYTLGSGVSLNCASEALNAGDDILLMDADVLYSPEILRSLMNSPQRNCLLIDRDFESGDEPVKICLRSGQVVEFRKRLCPLLDYDSAGESVGFMRFAPDVAAALATQVGYYVHGGMPDAPHEEALRDLILAAPGLFTAEDVTGEPWIEIDFPEDLQRAREQILPAIESGSTL